MVGWFGNGGVQETKKEELVTSLPPSRNDRTRCWTARDAYFTCLNEQGLWLDGLNPKGEAEIMAIDPKQILLQHQEGKGRPVSGSVGPCTALREAFESSCLASWVGHFSSLRVKELQTQFLRDKIAAEDAKPRDDAFWDKVKVSPSLASPPPSTSSANK